MLLNRFIGLLWSASHADTMHFEIYSFSCVVIRGQYMISSAHLRGSLLYQCVWSGQVPSNFSLKMLVITINGPFKASESWIVNSS